MKILYGTTNKAKIQVMKNAIESLDIELIGLGDMAIRIYLKHLAILIH